MLNPQGGKSCTRQGCTRIFAPLKVSWVDLQAPEHRQQVAKLQVMKNPCAFEFTFKFQFSFIQLPALASSSYLFFQSAPPLIQSHARCILCQSRNFFHFLDIRLTKRTVLHSACVSCQITEECWFAKSSSLRETASGPQSRHTNQGTSQAWSNNPLITNLNHFFLKISPGYTMHVS